MIKAKVAVCIVTYNQQNYIKECLDSVLSQSTSFKFTVYISDDSSTDSTAKIISEYKNKFDNVVVLVNQRNQGALKNFQKIHNLALEKYVCHCDGDDKWLPGKLQKQFDFLEKNPDYTVCWTKSNYFNDSGKWFDGSKTGNSFFGKENRVDFDKAAQIGAVAMHSSIMYRRTARKTFDISIDRIDFYYSLEYLLSGYGKILPEVLTEYRVQSKGAITRNSGTKIKRLSANHVSYFLKRFPKYAPSFFVFCFVNLVVDIKNNRDTKLVFLKLSLKTFSLRGLLKLLRFLPYLKKFEIPLQC